MGASAKPPAQTPTRPVPAAASCTWNASAAAAAPPSVPPPPMPASLMGLPPAAKPTQPETNAVPVTIPDDAPVGVRESVTKPSPPAAAAAGPDVDAAATADGTAPAPAAASVPVMSRLDLVFCCDCTGSMGAYLKSAQDNIREIAQTIHRRKGETCVIRFALVKYRDHPPQDRTFVTETFPFTRSLEVMKANVDTMSASGGGDGPEAVTAALQEVRDLDWDPEATKVCVLISDAPPHGLGESGDGFPNGDPDGRDPIALARDLAQKAVTLYAIGVEPILSTQYKFARDFMMMLASLTSGKFLPLGKAGILSQVIVSGSIEGIELDELWRDVEASIACEAKAKGEGALGSEELTRRVEAAMAERAKAVAVEQVHVANPYMCDEDDADDAGEMAAYDRGNCEAMLNATSLHAARAHLQPQRNAHVPQAVASYAWGAQEAKCRVSHCSEQQVMRSANVNKSKRSGPQA